MDQQFDKQEVQKEIEQKKKEQERKLIIKAHQIRAICMSGDTEFFKIGQEECDLLKKVFPDEADKLLAQAMKEKFQKAENKEKKNPGSVNKSSLLQELEGLCGKAFKLMLQNMKPKSNQSQKQNSLSDAEKGISNSAQMSEVENVNEKNAVKESQEMQQSVVEKNKDKGIVKNIKENIDDGYHEGMTGEKVIREKEEPVQEVAPLSKKEQKKLEKEQKKAEKEQRKEAKKQKVAPISKEDLNKANDNGNKKTIDQIEKEKYEKEKLEEYNRKLQDRVAAKESQKSSENVREMSGPVRKKN